MAYLFTNTRAMFLLRDLGSFAAHNDAFKFGLISLDERLETKIEEMQLRISTTVLDLGQENQSWKMRLGDVVMHSRAEGLGLLNPPVQPIPKEGRFPWTSPIKWSRVQR